MTGLMLRRRAAPRYTLSAMDMRLKPEQADDAASPFTLRLPRSLAFRLALFYGVVFAASAATLIGIVYFTTAA